MCKMVNPIDNNYFCPINEQRQRTDKYSRLELHKGVYDFIASD